MTSLEVHSAVDKQINKEMLQPVTFYLLQLVFDIRNSRLTLIEHYHDRRSHINMSLTLFTPAVNRNKK